MRRRCAGSPPTEAGALPESLRDPAAPGGRLLLRLEEADHRWGLLTGAPALLVAVSGGADSVALLHLLVQLREARGLRLGVAHLNHRLRGRAAEEDAEYVAELACGWELSAVVESADVPALAAAQGLSLEVAAREARYAFLERVAEAGGWDAVALGHTASDRVETVLLNLLRGSALHGLRGIPPRRGRFVRPLITAWREETAAYCAACDLSPREDATNLDPAETLRNRVRLELIPHLREAYNPAVELALLRLAEAAESELAATEPLVEEAVGRLLERGEGGVRLDRAGLAALPEGLRLRVWRAAWEELTGDAAGLTSAALRALETLLLERQTGRHVCLPEDIRAELRYNHITLAPSCARGRPALLPERVLVPGEAATLPEVGLSLCLEQLEGVPPELGEARGRQVVVDADRVRLPVTVRGWRAGDALRPLGMTGTKKLQDLFTDLKTPRERRGLVPVVVDGGGRILWVAGSVLEDGVKVTAATRRCLRLTLEEYTPTAGGPE